MNKKKEKTSNLTYSARLEPSASQEAELICLFQIRNKLYNDLLNIRDGYYQDYHRNMSSYDLMALLPALQQKDDYGKLNSKAAQVVARQVVKNYSSYKALLRNGFKDAKPPAPIELDRETSLTFNQSGWTFHRYHIKLSGIKEPIFFRSLYDFRYLKAKEVRIKYVDGKLLCDVVVDQYSKPSIDIVKKKHRRRMRRRASRKQPTIPIINKHTSGILAIDLGLKKLGVGIDSSGSSLVIPNITKKISQNFNKEIAKVNRKMVSKKYKSREYRRLKKVKDKLYDRRATQVRQTLHIQSNKIKDMNYKVIVLGDLSVKELQSRKKNKNKGVRKSFAETCISMFTSFIGYKCSIGTKVIAIDESWTTQTNCLTQELFDEKVELSQRIVHIADTICIDRDLNAAINILLRYANEVCDKAGELPYLKGLNIAELTQPSWLQGVLNVNNMFGQAKLARAA